MAIDKVKAYLRNFGLETRIIEFEESSATVELAALALNCEPARIAKTLSFHLKDKSILVVTAGDTKIDNKKYHDTFGEKAKMLAFEEVESLIGHAVGGVCPFALNENVEVYLDVSMKRFESVFPAAGSSNSAIELTLDEMEQYSLYKEWVDVCKGWDSSINGKISSSVLLINVIYTVKDGKREEFYYQLCDKGIITKSRNEEGNLKYDYYFPVDNSNDILLLEIWTDATSQQIHTQTPHFLELQELKKKYILNVKIEKFKSTPL